MKQIFVASSFFQLVGLAAGIDAKVYDSSVRSYVELHGPGKPDETFSDVDERILLVSDSRITFDLGTHWSSAPGTQSLLQRFDRVVNLNDLIDPHHPQTWAPRDNELPMWERLFRSQLHLGNSEIDLVVESPQVNPAIALGRVFHSARIRVHADGLMSYGPTRNKIPLTNGQRLTSLHYAPLVEGLEPRLLSEYFITPQALPKESLLAVFNEIGTEVQGLIPESILELNPDTTAFAVGQYLASLSLLSHAEEDRLHQQFLDAAHAAGMSTVVFKPHPAAPVASTEKLLAHATALGINLHVLHTPVVVESVLEIIRPALIIGCFSTALATARGLFNIPARAVGTDFLLERLTPYQNSNRIPVTIIDAVMDGTADPLSPQEQRELQMLIDAVSYAMGANIVPHLRTSAQRYLDTHAGSPTMKYFKKKRLTALQLPGGSSTNAKVRAKQVAKIASLYARSGLNTTRHVVGNRFRKHPPA